MAKCSYCRTLMWGGITDQGQRFCSEACHQKARFLAGIQRVPVEQVEQKVQSVHQGNCPKCGGTGPVDIFQSHRAISLILATRWETQTHLCCRACGHKEQIKDLLISLAFGWWGFPFGLIATPVQIIRNLVEMSMPPDPLYASISLRQAIQNYLGQLIQAEAEHLVPVDLSNSPTEKGQETTMTQPRQTEDNHAIADQPRTFQSNGMKRLSKFVRWAMVGFTGLMLLGAFLSMNLGALLGFWLAIAIIIPLLDEAIATRLPWLKSGWVKGVIWFVCIVFALAALPSAPSTSSSPTSVPSSLPPSLTDVKLCTQPQQNFCQTDVTQVVKGRQPLYVSGVAENVPDGTAFVLKLVYFPEPFKAVDLEQATARAKVEEGKLLLAMTPKNLPIGAYELRFSAALDGGQRVSDIRAFTVWDTAKEVKRRTGNTLPESSVDWSTLEMCDRSGKPVPNEKTKGEEFGFCPKDATQFRSDMTALGFKLDSSTNSGGHKVKVIWRYTDPKTGKPVIASESVKQFEKSGDATVSFLFTLTSNEGFPPGNYELIVAEEARNAKPVYRKFTVKAA